MFHQQIKLYEGVYMTDFRKGATLKGLEITKHTPKDVNLMMDDLHQLESKIKKLLESIELIKEEEEWEKDEVYMESINEDYGLVLKYSDEQLQIGQKIKQLNYHPQKEEDSQVLDAKRITDRKDKAKAEYADFSKKYLKASPAEEEDEGVFV